MDDVYFSHCSGHICACDSCNNRQQRFAVCLVWGSLLGHRTILYTVWCRYNTVNFHPNPHKRHTIAPPVPERARCGISFVNITSDTYFSTVVIVPCAKLCYIGPRYNGTRLYIGSFTWPCLLFNRLTDFMILTDWLTESLFHSLPVFLCVCPPLCVCMCLCVCVPIYLPSQFQFSFPLFLLGWTTGVCLVPCAKYNALICVIKCPNFLWW